MYNSLLTGQNHSRNLAAVFVWCFLSFFFSKLHIENDETSWAPPDMTYCKVVVSFPDLDNVTVTPGQWVYLSF